MNFDLISIVFVLSLIIARWFLPPRYMGIIYPIYGFTFISYYSPLSALLWLGFSTALVIFCYIKQFLIRVIICIVILSLFGGLYKNDFIVVSFPYEFLIFFVCNLSRGWTMYKYQYAARYDSISLSEMFSFLWFPALLCGGPIETFKEFVKYHTTRQSIATLAVTGYFLSSIIAGFLRDFVSNIWNPRLFTFYDATLLQFAIYFIMASVLLFLRFIAWIHFVRAICHLLGYPFNNANCGNFLFGGGIVQFWSRLNLSVTSFARDYLIYPTNRIPTNLETSLRILILVTLMGYLVNFSVYTFIWGALQGFGFIAHIIYRVLCAKRGFIAKLDKRIPKLIKVIIILTWVFITTPLLTPEAPILYEYAGSRLLSLWVLS